MNENFTINGRVTIIVIGPRGCRRYVKNNLVVDAGKNLVRDLLNGGSGNAISRIALGTGTTAASASDTGLESQSFIKNITQKVISTKQILSKLFITTSEISGTFNEAGLFASTTLFSRVVLDVAIVKASDESLYLEWELNF